MSKNKKFIFISYVLLVFLLLVLLEFFSYIISKFFLSNYGALFDKNKITQNYNNYLKKRHNILGWDARHEKFNAYLIELDDDDARIDHSSFKNSKKCADVYGDSFTWGHTNGEYSWPSVLSELLKCRVRNFGVPAYGTDQAYMKFLLNNNSSKIVILNHFSENVIRNINQFRNCIYPNKNFMFKPRYIFDGDSLKLVPLPKISNKEIYKFLNQPEIYLSDEYFIPNGGSGVQSYGFFYSIKVLKIFNHWHFKQKFRNSSRYIKFYSKDHASGALKLTFEIMNDFYRRVSSQGDIPILTILPHCRDLEYFLKSKKYPYENLANLFVQAGIKYIDFGTEIINKQGNNFKKLYDNCSGHFNEEGEKIIADIFYEYIHKNDLLRKY